jgi:hypothetical protein
MARWRRGKSVRRPNIRPTSPVRTPPPAWYCRRIQDLDNLLKLDEMVTRTDRPELHASELKTELRQLATEPRRAAVGFEIQPSALLDSVELSRIHAEPIHGEEGPLNRGPDNVLRRELPAIRGWMRKALAHPSVEIRDRVRIRPPCIERDQGHAAVHGRVV